MTLTKEALQEIIEPIIARERRKFSDDKRDIDVYWTPDKCVCLKIYHQTFELKTHSDEDTDEYQHSAWLAHQLSIAINRLITYSAGKTLDNRPMTIRLSEKNKAALEAQLKEVK